MRLSLVAAVCTIAPMIVVASANDAAACDCLVDTPDPNLSLQNSTGVAGDLAAPTVVVRVERGIAPSQGAPCCSCSRQHGFIEFVVGPENDDLAVADVGYELEVIDGALPCAVPDLPTLERVSGSPSHSIECAWSDGAEFDQEPLFAVVRIRAVDGAGNVSAWTEVTVDDPGRGDQGCAVGTGTTVPAALVVLFVYAIVRRRRVAL